MTNNYPSIDTQPYYVQAEGEYLKSSEYWSKVQELLENQ